MPELWKPEADRRIREPLDLAIIRPSSSEMASPIVCISACPRSENGVGLAVVFVDKFSQGDAFPTPDIIDANSTMIFHVQKIAIAHLVLNTLKSEIEQQWIMGLKTGLSATGMFSPIVWV